MRAARLAHALLVAAVVSSPVCSLQRGTGVQSEAPGRAEIMAWSGPAAIEVAEMGVAQEWTRLESHLGWRQRGRLEEARLRLELFEELNPGTRRSEEDPLREEMKEELRDAYLDVFEDELTRAFPIEEALRERFSGRSESTAGREQLRHGLRLRFSPQLGVSDDSYLGAKVRVRAAAGRRFWDHLSLFARHRVASGGEEVGLKFDNGRFFVALEHQREHERGVEWALTVHASF